MDLGLWLSTHRQQYTSEYSWIVKVYETLFQNATKEDLAIPDHFTSQGYPVPLWPVHLHFSSAQYFPPVS